MICSTFLYLNEKSLIKLKIVGLKIVPVSKTIFLSLILDNVSLILKSTSLHVFSKPLLVGCFDLPESYNERTDA
jgi:hypothetical protein